MTETSVTHVPHSRAAEESLLGALLIDPEAARTIVLDADEFYIIRNGWVYAAIVELVRTHRPVDYVTVCTYLDSQKRLGEIGGPAFIMGLIGATASSLNADAYAAIIRERARRRKIILAAQRLTTGAFDLDSDLGQHVSDAIDVLTKSVITDKGARHISDYIGQVYDRVNEAAKNPTEIYGIPTGFYDWDAITYGLQRGEKVLLSGEPGVGKSVLAAQVLINAAKKGYPGVLYELEMSAQQVVRRSLAAHVKDCYSLPVTTQKMQQGRLTEGEIAAFTDSVEEMSKLPIYISEASEITTVEMRADIIRLKENYGVQLVMIDYEGLLGDAPDKDMIQRNMIISKRTHDIAKDLDIAMIAIGDMTKEGIKQQVKGQGSVAGTARSLHDADQIVIMRKSSQDEDKVRLTWEKMREGESDRYCDLMRERGWPMFRNVARVPAQQFLDVDLPDDV